MRSSRNLADNVSRITNSIRNPRARARVVVFPECALSGYFEDAVTNLSIGQITVAARRWLMRAAKPAFTPLLAPPGARATSSSTRRSSLHPQAKCWSAITRFNWRSAGRNPAIIYPSSRLMACLARSSSATTNGIRNSCDCRCSPEARSHLHLHESGLRSEHKIVHRAQFRPAPSKLAVLIVQTNAPANEDLSGSHGQSRIIAPDGNIMHEALIFD